MNAFPAWSEIATDDANRLLGLNTRERDALVQAGEQRSIDYNVVMAEAIESVCMAFRGAMANNLALRDSLKQSSQFAIPQSLKIWAYPLIIRALYVRYQLNLSDARQKAAEKADEVLEKLASGELLPESVDGTPPADPAYMVARFSRRPWFNPIRSSYR